MALPLRPETVALYDLMSDGEWRNGVVVLQEIMRAVPPGEASRAAEVKDRSQWTAEQLVRMGARQRARMSITSAIETGRFEVDVEEKLRKAHWAGDIPWRIRDTEAGLMSVEAMADELDLGPHTIRLWVRNGYIPVSYNKAGIMRFTEEQQEIVRRVRAIYPGSGKIRWPVDPKTLWDKKESVITIPCPNCDHKLTVNLGVAE